MILEVIFKLLTALASPVSRLPASQPTDHGLRTGTEACPYG